MKSLRVQKNSSQLTQPIRTIRPPSRDDVHSAFQFVKDLDRKHNDTRHLQSCLYTTQ